MYKLRENKYFYLSIHLIIHMHIFKIAIFSKSLFLVFVTKYILKKKMTKKCLIKKAKNYSTPCVIDI